MKRPDTWLEVYRHAQTVGYPRTFAGWWGAARDLWRATHLTTYGVQPRYVPQARQRP